MILVSKLREHIFVYLSKDSFLKAVTKLSGATVVGQFISLLASVILTRIYTPEDFGLLAIFIAILTQLTVFTSFRYEWAIPPAQNEEEAFHLVLLCFLLVLGCTLFTAFAVAYGASYIAQALNTPHIAQYLYLLPAGVLFIGWYQIFNYWALRKKQFSLLATSQITKSLSTSFSQILLGLLRVGPIGLLVGVIINQISGTNILATQFLKDYRTSNINFSFDRLLQTLSKYSRFAGICMLSSFFNYAAIAAPPVLLSVFYTQNDVGSFSLAQRVSSLPIVFIGSSISQVYFASACILAHENPKELKRLHTRTTLLLFAISLLAGFVFMLSPLIMPFIFGSQWKESAKMTQYMAPMLILTISISPLTMLEWLGKNTEILVWHTIRLSLVILGFFMSNYFQLSASLSIGIFSVITGFMYAILLMLNRYAIDDIIKGKADLTKFSSNA